MSKEQPSSAHFDRMQIEDDFQLFVMEIDRALREGLLVAALYMIVTMPDVCAALEAPDALAGERYTKWCNRYFEPSEVINGADRWAIRNRLLHQGISELRSERYSWVSFLHMYNAADGRHLRTFATKDGRKGIMVDPAELWSETRTAMTLWLDTIERPENADLLERVVSNSITLLRERGQVFEPGDDPEIVFAGGEPARLELITLRRKQTR